MTSIPTYLKDITSKVQEGLGENKKIIILNGEDHVPTGQAPSGDLMIQMFAQKCGKPLFIEAGKQIALIQCLERAGIRPNEICLLGEHDDVDYLDIKYYFSAMGFREYSLLKNISHHKSGISRTDRQGGAVSSNRAYAKDIIAKLLLDRNNKGMVFSIGSMHLLETSDIIEKGVIKLGKEKGLDIKVIKTFSDNGSAFSDYPLKVVVPTEHRKMMLGKKMSDKKLKKHLETKYFPNLMLDTNGSDKYFENLCKKVLFEEIRSPHRQIETRMQFFTMPNCTKTVVKIEGLKSPVGMKLNGQIATLQGVANSTPFIGYERYKCAVDTEDGTLVKKIKPINLQLVLEPDPQLFPTAHVALPAPYPTKEQLAEIGLDGGKRTRRRKKKKKKTGRRRKTRRGRKKRRN